MDSFPSGINGYTPVCLCGRGAYGQVWLVTDAVGCYRALKIISKSMLGGDWEREFKGLKLYQTKIKSHPNLVQIFHIEDCGNFFYYTMECADNLGAEEEYLPSTLANRLKQSGALKTAELVPIFNQLLDGIEALHAGGLIHRDIKPDNIMFVDSKPKLGDIGLVGTSSHTLSMIGTQSFMPPEILTGEKKEIEFDVDIYALGKTLYCAFTGQSPCEFPLVPNRIPAETEGKALNALAKALCHPRRSKRIVSGNEFRKALAQLQIARPTKKKLWKLLTALGVLLFSVLPGVVILIRPGVISSQEEENITLVPPASEVQIEPWPDDDKSETSEEETQKEYNLYDFYQKTKESVKLHGEKWLAGKEEYFRVKYPVMPIIEPAPGENRKKGFRILPMVPPPEGNMYMNAGHSGKIIARSMGWDVWDLSEELTKGSSGYLLPPVRRGRLKMLDEFPMQYGFDFIMIAANSKIDYTIVLTAGDYTGMEKSGHKRQVRFPVKCDNGEISFGPALFREEGRKELIRLGEPKIVSPGLRILSIPMTPENGYRIRVINVEGKIIVYCNSECLWVVRSPFYGGKLTLEYSYIEGEPFTINDFCFSDFNWTQGLVPSRVSEIMKSYSDNDLDVILEAMPDYGMSARRIADKAWLGSSTGYDNDIEKDKLVLSLGKTFLMEQKIFPARVERHFTVSMGSPQNSLKIIPVPSGERTAKNPDFKGKPGWSTISGQNTKDKIDFHIIKEKDNLVLRGVSKGAEVYSSMLSWKTTGVQLIFEADVEEGKLQIDLSLNAESNSR